jgi:hypothetical protein
MSTRNSRLKRLLFNITVYFAKVFLVIASAPSRLVKSHKHTRFWSIFLVCISMFIAVVLISIPSWLFWRLLFKRLLYWHMLIFCIFNVSFLSWYCLAKKIREKYFALRIIEQLIALGFFALVILFLAEVL